MRGRPAIKLFLNLALVLLCVLGASSCMDSKALIDRTLQGGIVWPGRPAEPRIQYLWSLSVVSGASATGRLTNLITGDDMENIGNPRAANVLINPHGIFMDPAQRLLVADSGGMRIAAIDTKTLDSMFFYFAGSEELISPIDVVSTDGGEIIVSDSELARVLVYSPKGRYLRDFEGEFKRPSGLALDSERGRLYITDTWAHAIHVYDVSGGRLATYGRRGAGPGEFNYPTHIAVGPGGRLYVSDTMNFRISVLEPDGAHVTSFGLVGDAIDAFDKIKGIAVDSEGHIYVVDSLQHMVKIFDMEGRLLLFFGRKGHGYGEFFLPMGIHIDQNDRIYVSDSWNMRIQAFQYLQAAAEKSSGPDEGPKGANKRALSRLTSKTAQGEPS